MAARGDAGTETEKWLKGNFLCGRFEPRKKFTGHFGLVKVT